MVWRRTKQAMALVVLLIVVVVGFFAVVVKVGGGHLLTVQSDSMVPVIKKGDLVVVTRVPASALQVGDVVTFVNPANNQQTITHRIVEKIGSSSFKTKGDANQQADTVIPAVSVVGRVARKLPMLGGILDIVRHPAGLLLIVYLPAVVVVGGELKNLSAYYKKIRVYRLHPRTLSNKYASGRGQIEMKHVLSTTALMIPVLLIGRVTSAALGSRVTLAGNSIVATSNSLPGGGSCSAHNNIYIRHNNNQTATTGDVDESNNTNGNSANSGDSSNSSRSTINININNCQ